MQLEYIQNSGHCLTAKGSTSEGKLYIDTCNNDTTNNQHQLWRWDKHGNLQHFGTGFCAVVSEDELQLGSCNVTKQWTCLPYALKTKTGTYLAASDDKSVYLDSSGAGRWKRLGDPSTSICHYTGKICSKLCLTFLFQKRFQKICLSIKSLVYQTSFLYFLSVKSLRPFFIKPSSLSEPVFSIDALPYYHLLHYLPPPPLY